MACVCIKSSRLERDICVNQYCVRGIWYVLTVSPKPLDSTITIRVYRKYRRTCLMRLMSRVSLARINRLP